MTSPFAALQEPTAAELNQAVQKIIKRGRRVTTSSASTSTTDIGVLRVSSITVLEGDLVAVQSSPLGLDSSVTNDEVRARVRYRLDGVDAGVTDTILPGSKVQTRQTDANVPEHKTIFATLPIAADGTLSVLLCVARLAGTGNATIFADGTEDIIELCVWNMGPDPGDSGVDV